LVPPLWEKHILRVFEDRVPRKIFGAKKDEVIGTWRNLPNDLYCSPSIMIKSRIM